MTNTQIALDDLENLYCEESIFKQKKYALVEIVYPEILAACGGEFIRVFNDSMSLVEVPLAGVKDFKNLYNSVGIKCIVAR